jgi:LPPG:FO 2-phospho-L-lactate transferase
LERTRRLKSEQPLSQITRDFCAAWEVGPTVLPMSDDSIPTIVLTEEGELTFQEYFVHRQCEPRVQGFRFQGSEKALPAPGAIEAIRQSDLVVICPSNPWVSIDPILAVPNIRSEISSRPVVAVSPIIGGKAVKGPVIKMYAELGIKPSALAVAEHYHDFLSGFVFDQVDAALESDIERLNVLTLTVPTFMGTASQRKCLAQDVLSLVNYSWRK